MSSPSAVARAADLWERSAVRLGTAARSLQARGRRLPSWALVGLAMAVGMGIIISRRPDVISYPQLWAEDGRVFFLQAYQMGFWASLWHPYAGYLQLTPRLAIGLAMLLPLVRLPLVLNLIGLLIQAAPAAFIMSDRWDPLLPSRLTRAALALVYVALPNTGEIDVNITNAQWHLAVLACLVLLAPAVPGRGWRTFDFLVTILAGLSGPFAILLAPGAVVLATARRSAHQVALGLVVLLTAAVEGLTLLANNLGRSGSALKLPFHLHTLLQVLTERVLVMPLLGVSETNHLVGLSLLSNAPADAGLLLVAAGLSLFALARGPLELKLFLLFGGLLLASSLVRLEGMLPLVIAPSGAARYFFIPMLGWLAALAYSLARWRRTAVGLALLGGLALLLLFAAVSSWEYPGLPHSHFYRDAAIFSRARPGQRLLVPENPVGWSFTVVKR